MFWMAVYVGVRGLVCIWEICDIKGYIRVFFFFLKKILPGIFNSPPSRRIVCTMSLTMECRYDFFLCFILGGFKRVYA
jgi:hypothetical protein